MNTVHDISVAAIHDIKYTLYFIYHAGRNHISVTIKYWLLMIRKKSKIEYCVFALMNFSKKLGGSIEGRVVVLVVLIGVVGLFGNPALLG